MGRRLFMPVVLAVLLALAGPVAGQTIFITNGDASQMQAIDVVTGAINFTATTHNIGYPIAVRNTVWIGDRDNVRVSREYTLGGSFTGNQVTLSGGNPGNFVDGAVNGATNYTITAFGSPGQVFQANTDWTNPTLMFNTTAGSDFIGVTYDPVLSRLWISSSTNFYRYTLGGALEATFPHTAGRAPIAWDPRTDTLWLVPNNPTLPLLQYSKTGTLLQSLTTPTRSNNVFGAEFAIAPAAVPEPATLAVLGMGAVGGVTWLRRKRRVRISRS